MIKKFIFAACFVALANVAQAQLSTSSGVNTSKQSTVAQESYNMSTVEGSLTTTIDISGIATGGDVTPDVMLSTVLAPGMDATVVGVGWDVVLDSFDPSWLSEASVDFNGALSLSPGAGDDFPGLGVAYSSGGIIDLTSIDDGMGGTLDLSFAAPGGALDLTFFESFDDGAVAPDGMWLAGSSLTVEYIPVPEPTTIVLLGMAGLGLLGLRRR